MLVESHNVLMMRDGLALYGGDADGKYWLFDTVSGQHFRLNHVGFIALSLVDGVRSVEQIENECAAHYKVETDVVSSDIVEFLTECLKKGLVSV